MAVWYFTFGRGWFDQAPPEVREARGLFDQPLTEGALCANASSAFVGGLPDFSGCPLCGQGLDSDVVASTFHTIGWFLARLDEPRYDVVSLIFLNLRAKTFDLSPRPAAVAPRDCSEHEGLQLFAGSVYGSVQGEGMWSSCEWVMLTARREE